MPVLPEGRVNVVDPDSRVMRTVGQPTIQGYNAQAAVTAGQIIVAAEITIESPDFGHLEPVFNAALRDLQLAGVSQRPGVLVADAGYWHKLQLESIVSDGTQVLILPTQASKTDPGLGGPAGSMTSCVACSRLSTATRSTVSDRKRSSRCSGTPSTTAGSGSSNDEANPRSARNGASSPRPTT